MSQSLPRAAWPSREAGPVLRLACFSAILSDLGRQGNLSRAGRVYPWIIALGHAALLVVARSGDTVPARAVLGSALGVMSWAGGAVAWGAAGRAASSARADALFGLARERGMTAPEQRLAHAIATMRVVARSIGFPGVCLALVAGACGTERHRAVSALWLAALVAGYAVLFGVVLGGLARFTAAAFGRQGRLVFAAVVLGPYALSASGAEAWRDVPSVVGVLGALLDRLAGAGGPFG